MKAAFFVAWLAAHGAQALANPNAIYRCGNEYLNDAAVAQARGCSLVEGGAVTVTGTRVQSPGQLQGQGQIAMPQLASMPAPARPALPQAPSWRTDNSDQRARDRDALSILQAELSKAQALLAERQREPTDPQRQASRLADVSRHLSDIASLKREISRLPVPSTSQSTLQSK